MTAGGFFSVPRSVAALFDITDDHGAYTAASAAFWLFEKAAFGPSIVNVRSHRVALRRGELCLAQSYLAKAFGWSKGKAQRFLQRLTDAGEIEQRAAPGGHVVITLINYDWKPKARVDDEPPCESPEQEISTCAGSDFSPGVGAGESRCESVTKSPASRSIRRTKKRTTFFSDSNESSVGERARESPDNGFEQWWDEYPHKVGGKADCRRAYAAAAIRASPGDLLEGMRRYKAAKPPDQHWLNPDNFLKRDRWLDQAATLGGNNADYAPSRRARSLVDREDATRSARRAVFVEVTRRRMEARSPGLAGPIAPL